jgi:seryl-tRNA synthetase
MLSRELLRQEPERVAEGLRARGVEAGTVERWSELDERRRALLVEVEERKRQRNEASKMIGQLKSKGEDADEQIAAVAELKKRIESDEQELGEVDDALVELERSLPNLAHPDVPEGEDEEANRVERVVGEPPTFDFEAQNHWDLGPALGILDFERGAKLAGSRFTVLQGAGARLERALANFMLDLHTGEHGYHEVLPPTLANAESLFGSGQLPKFEEDLFKVDPQGYYLIPTAEVPLVNLHRDEILDEAELPIHYTAWTPCYRAEAGSHGRDVRGLIRQHQFHKVELVQLTTPDTSYDALEELTGQAETVLKRLELPYRVVCLSTGDMGFAAAKTYDLEVWLPGQGTYREISSCSNCEDFQARRANLRYRPAEGGKPRWLHTLNGSGLAVGRTLIAVVENYQQADGSVVIPEALRPYMRGLERLEPMEESSAG